MVCSCYSQWPPAMSLDVDSRPSLPWFNAAKCKLCGQLINWPGINNSDRRLLASAWTQNVKDGFTMSHFNELYSTLTTSSAFSSFTLNAVNSIVAYSTGRARPHIYSKALVPATSGVAVKTIQQPISATFRFPLWVEWDIAWKVWDICTDLSKCLMRTV